MIKWNFLSRPRTSLEVASHVPYACDCVMANLWITAHSGSTPYHVNCTSSKTTGQVAIRTGTSICPSQCIRACSAT
eukprot:scaffold231726_cov42-Prasinocladus_malaysianus.AAC.1